MNKLEKKKKNVFKCTNLPAWNGHFEQQQWVWQEEHLVRYPRVESQKNRLGYGMVMVKTESELVSYSVVNVVPQSHLQHLSAEPINGA